MIRTPERFSGVLFANDSAWDAALKAPLGEKLTAAG